MNKWQKLLTIGALIGAVVFVVEHKKKQGFACPDPCAERTPVAPPARFGFREMYAVQNDETHARRTEGRICRSL
jgi:hypothetical protein